MEGGVSAFLWITLSFVACVGVAGLLALLLVVFLWGVERWG